MADKMDGDEYSEEQLFRGFVLERILNEGLLFDKDRFLTTRSLDQNSLPSRKLSFPQSNPNRRKIRLLRLPRISLLPSLHKKDTQLESSPEE